MKNNVAELIEITIGDLIKAGILPKLDRFTINVEFTKDKSHGDLASNVALTLSKKFQMPAIELAQLIQRNIPSTPFLERCEVAGAGFLNFFLTKDTLSTVLFEILEKKAAFGSNKSGNGAPALIEFVSANPTGPLHVGHGRGAAIGDSLCRLLRVNGWNTHREFFYNDAGQQIRNLALSVQARCLGLSPEDPEWPKDGYCGEYIKDVAKAYLKGDIVETRDRTVKGTGEAENLDEILAFSVAFLRREQDKDLENFDVHFDSFFLESSLYENGELAETVSRLVDSGYTYEKDGALWLSATKFGDDKDRVMQKKDGSYTYFVPDVAYHLNKWERGYSKAINEQGADHHGTIARVRAGLEALDKNIPKEWPIYLLHQMVNVVRNGEEVKISKRTGDYVTLSELINEVGRDATRYFLVARAPNSQLVFDIDLALSRSNDNPVFYIQYAHARISSVLRKMNAIDPDWSKDINLASSKLLIEEQEHALLQFLSRYPEVIRRAGQQHEPHSVAIYLRELASEFHSYYNNYKVLVEDKKLREARLILSEGIRQVIANGLHILGVSAPEEM